MESTTLLCRADIREVDPDLLVDHNVLAYAEHKLGYKHPERDRKLARGELSTALRVMGTKPFTPESVKLYQPAEVSRGGLTGVWSKIGQFTSELWPFMALSCIVGLGASLIHCMNLAAAKTPFSGWYFVHWSSVPFVMGLIGLITHVFIERRRLYHAAWRAIELKDYEGPVPEFVLAIAVELHQRVPQAKLFIEELVIMKRERPSFVNDPFLKVSLDGEAHYLEVWKEPGYKQQRMA